MPHHDLVIIGTGSGNSLVTDHLEGLDIAIIEEGVFGGTCLNVGCIPTKMYVVPADRVREAADGARLGLDFAPPQVDWPAIRDRIFGRIDPIARGGEDYRRSQDFVTVYGATARFVGERRLALSTGQEVTGNQVVVAAGSRVAMPDVDGLREVAPEQGLHTSDTVMRMERLPERMVVLGGGFVACEFAHVFSSLGVQVTQVQRSERLLRREEDSIGRRYTELSAEHLDLRLETTVTSAERVDGVWRVGVKGPEGDATIEAEVVLAAMGRRPNTDRIDARAGGLALDDGGVIEVNLQQRASVDGVWALGDIANHWQLKHVANHEARIVAHNLAVTFGRISAPLRENDARPVPHGVFGHPQIAAFGPTSAELDQSGTPYVTKSQDFGDVAFGWALEDRTGFLVVHASPDGDILAAHCIGPHASTVIQPLIQAASFGQLALDVAQGQYWIHPALSEVVENALLGLPLHTR